MEQFVYVCKLLKSFRKPLIIVALISMLLEVLALVPFFCVGHAIKLAGNGNRQNAEEWAVLFGLSWLLVSFVNLKKEKFEILKVNWDLDTFLMRSTIHQILSLSPEQHHSQHTGVVQGVIKRGEHAFATSIYRIFYPSSRMILKTFVVLLALLFKEPVISTIVCVAILLFVLASLRANQKLVPPIFENQKYDIRIDHTLTEMIRNVALIVASNQQRAQEDLFVALREEQAAEGKKVWCRYCDSRFLRTLVCIVARVMVLGYVIFQICEHPYLVGPMFTILGWTEHAFFGLDSFDDIHREFLKAWPDIAKYTGILNTVSTVPIASNPIFLGKNTGAVGNLEFKNVSHVYTPHGYIDQSSEPSQARVALRNVSFCIKRGEKVALVGAVGSGKSTILNMLLRCFDPTSGQILIDGHDLRLLDPDDLRSMIVKVDQHPNMFDQTLGMNLTFGLSSQVPREILEGYVRQFNLPPLSERVGEGGLKLSGGQRQIAAILRAVLRDPKIILLDEVTSNLDGGSVAEVLNVIRCVTEGRTAVMVTHTAAVLELVHRVYVLRDGEIVDSGTPSELAEHSLAYRELFPPHVLQEVA